MKHLTLLAAMALTTGAFAQRTAISTGHPVHVNIFNAERTPTDTLVGASLANPNSTLTLYLAGTDASSGYVVGTNQYGDKAKVQVFTSTGNVLVEQLIYIFAAKDEAGAPSSAIHARIYGLDGAGTNGAGTTISTAPGSVLGNVDIAISACDTTNLTIAYFSPAIAVSGNFAGGFDVSDLATGVALGLASTSDGDPGSSADQTWEKFADDSWVSMSNATLSWNVKFDLAIFAVIGDGVAGINDIATVNNMRMSLIGSNPADKKITVAYEMLKAADARLLVLDGKGAKVVDQQLGQTATGLHQSDLNVSDWSNGTYYVSVIASGNPITKKLVVQH